MSPQAYSQAKAEQARRFQNRITPRPYDGDDVTEFIETEMYIPEMGKPMALHSEQRDVLRAMCHKTDGKFDYSLWMYSAPKKSIKTTIGAAVALWQGWAVPYGEVYIIGNDLKQADNRMANAIRYTLLNNPRFKNRARIVKNTIYLDNGTKIESIPVDPKGEAGMNPTGLFWTEAWGAMGNKPELMWSEAALSPTRVGQSFKFVESYAGFEGQSEILERLYKANVKPEYLHPSIPELYINGTSIAYWCTRRYLPWQVDNPAYYVQEAKDKTPQEFDRVHGNIWSTSKEMFVPIQWWDACDVRIAGGVLSALNGRGVVMGIDAAVENDCFAVVIVSINNGKPQVRYCNVWKPSIGMPINFATIETELIRLFKAYNVVEVAYDPYQMASMAQRLSGLVFWKAFTQGAPRLVSDKRLYDMIRDRQLEHAGEYADLRQHIINSDRKPEEDKMRIIKRNQEGKIDACVALSMAVDRVMKYNL